MVACLWGEIMTDGITAGAYKLDADRIEETLARLRLRIAARFPNASLGNVCASLVATARETATSAAALAQPMWWLRALALIVATGWAIGTVYVVREIDWAALSQRADVTSLAQGLDSAVNLLLLAGAAIWFVLSLEERIKRSATLAKLHALRSFAHVIDMHQLTKDPTMILAGASSTAASPERHMTEFELARYLDFCAEMLALTAKLAALYAGASSDRTILQAATEVEDLASDLGRKIWQKIMILSQLNESRTK
jgi:hypothetical protein